MKSIQSLQNRQRVFILSFVIIVLLIPSLSCGPTYGVYGDFRQVESIEYFTVYYPLFLSKTQLEKGSEIRNPVAKTLFSVAKEELEFLGYKYTEDWKLTNLMVFVDYKIQKNKALVLMGMFPITEKKNVEDIDVKAEILRIEQIEIPLTSRHEYEEMKQAIQELVRGILPNRTQNFKA